MPEPLTLSIIGAVVLTEGIKFLYNQASDALKRWHEHKSKIKEAIAQVETPKTERTPAKLPDIFQGQLNTPQIHFEELEKVQGPLNQLRKDLSDYKDHILPVDPADPELLKKVDALRRLLEVIYQQRITFKGENREPSGPRIITHIEVSELLGRAEGVKIDEMTGGLVETNLKIDTVGPEGEVSGGSIKKIG